MHGSGFAGIVQPPPAAVGNLASAKALSWPIRFTEDTCLSDTQPMESSRQVGLSASPRLQLYPWRLATAALPRACRAGLGGGVLRRGFPLFLLFQGFLSMRTYEGYAQQFLDCFQLC